MKVETMGKMLIAVGVVILLYAMSMPVSVGDSGIVNIHLISERQNTLLFGGLMFLAGIVLFAVFKMKQTKEESYVAEKLHQERAEKAKVLVDSALQVSAQGAAQITKSVSEKINRGPLSILMRGGTGIFVGLMFSQTALRFIGWMLWLYTDNFLEWYGEISVTAAVIVVCTVLAFRMTSTLKAMVLLFVGAFVLGVTLELIGHSLQRTKREECEKATFVSNKCMEVLYGQTTR